MRYIVLILLLCFAGAQFALAQCNESEPLVIINEVGNFAHNAEYAELLVIGYPNNPYANVNLENWILDDNSFPQTENGNEPGHLRLGECFSAVPPGTLILIYNERGPAAGIGTGGANVMIIPGNSSCLLGYEYQPSHQSPAYGTSYPVSPNWLDLTPLRNFGDAMQLLDAQGNLKHAIYWGDCTFGTQGSGAIHISTENLSVNNVSFSFQGTNNYMNVSSYTIGEGTPGEPNSPENASFIASLLNHVPVAALNLSNCQEVTQASGSTLADGVASVKLEGGQPPYSFQVVGPASSSFTTTENGDLEIKDLLPGTYSVTVTDHNMCTSVCSFDISWINRITESICEGDCTLLGEGNDPSFCYSWHPETDFQNPHAPTQEVCPRRNSVYSVIITNPDGQVVKEIQYQIEIKPIDVEIHKSFEVLCQGKNVQLDAGTGYDDYEWTNSAGLVIGNTSSIVITSQGTYTVSVTLDGCSATASATINSGNIPNLQINPSPALLCEESVTITASDGFIDYLWKKGGIYAGNGKEIQANQPGNYQLIATTGEGCTVTGNVQVDQVVPTPKISPEPAILCFGGSLILEAPAGYDAYEWKKSNSQVVSTEQKLPINVTSEYFLRVTDGAGCIGTASIVVSNSPTNNATITPGSPQVCQALPGKTSGEKERMSSQACTGQVNLGVSPNSGINSYIWSNSATNASINVSSVGVYTVQITDNAGCTKILEKEVVPCLLGEQLELEDGATRYICNPGNSIILDPGAGFVNYTWSTGATTQSIDVYEEGIYDVTVTMNGGGNSCWAKVSTNVVILDAAPVLDLEIYKPGVLDAAQPLVIDEDATGAMTFPNIDNDDQDNLLDLNDNNIAGMDNELVKIRLKSMVPVNGNFVTRVKLRATAGGNFIRIYRNADKTGAEYILGTEIDLTQIDPNGVFNFEDLWVEGILPHNVARQTRLELYCDTDGDCPGISDEVALTIVGIESLSWEGLNNNSENDNNVLTAETNGPSPNQPNMPVQPIDGVKVFPDARAPGGAALNIVSLKVRLSVQPVELIRIYLRSFDVDDPTNNNNPDPNYISFLDPNDNRNAVAGNYPGTGGMVDYTVDEDNRGGAPKSGSFVGQPGGGIASLDFPGPQNNPLENTINFNISTHPGDNYRAVAIHEPAFLNQLENLDHRDRLDIVEMNTLAPVPLNIVSNVLTVWRFLYVENRTMNRDTRNLNKLIRRPELNLDFEFRDFVPGPPNTAIVNAFDNCQDDLRITALLNNQGALIPVIDESLNLNTPVNCDNDGRFQNGTLRGGSFFVAQGQPSIEGVFNVLSNGERSVNVLGTNLANMRILLTDQAGLNFQTILTLNVLRRIVGPNGVVNYSFQCTVRNGTPLGNYANNPATIAFLNINAFPAGSACQVVNINPQTGTIITDAFSFIPNSLIDDDPDPNQLLPSLQTLVGTASSYSKVYLAPKLIPLVQQNTPFIANTEINLWQPAAQPPVTWVNHFGNLQNLQISQEDNNYWVVHVITGWQNGFMQDADPDVNARVQQCNNNDNLPFQGYAFNAGGEVISSRNVVAGNHGSLTFVGTFPEMGVPGGPPPQSQTTAHEIGHQFGLSHGDGSVPDPGFANIPLPEFVNNSMGLMDQGGTNGDILIPRYQNLIRSRITSPGH